MSHSVSERIERRIGLAEDIAPSLCPRLVPTSGMRRVCTPRSGCDVRGVVLAVDRPSAENPGGVAVELSDMGSLSGLQKVSHPKQHRRVDVQPVKVRRGEESGVLCFAAVRE